MIVIAEESRSQHENKTKALRRLRQAFFLRIRDELTPEERQPEALAQNPDLSIAMSAAGRLDLGRKDPRFWPAAGVVLDVLVAAEARVAQAAEALRIPTANLITFLQADPKLWQQANVLRQQFHQKMLR